MDEAGFDALRREVKGFLAESAKDQTPMPFMRIGEIIFAMRKYKSEIIAANAPCGFVKGSESDATKKESLCQHRLQYLNDDEGLKPQKEWFMSLNMEFVLQGALYRVQDTQWQFKVWSPLFRWAQRGFALIFDRKGMRDWPNFIGLAVLQEWEEEEFELERELFARMLDFLPEGEWPIVDLNNERLHWAGYDGKLTPRELRVLKFLIDQKGEFVGVDDICDEIREAGMSSSTFRKMIQRLRDGLIEVGFGEIEAAIEKSNLGNIRLNHDKLLESLAKRESAIA